MAWYWWALIIIGAISLIGGIVGFWINEKNRVEGFFGGCIICFYVLINWLWNIISNLGCFILIIAAAAALLTYVIKSWF